jgi:hypothetical protein
MNEIPSHGLSPSQPPSYALTGHLTSEKPKGEILFPASFPCSLFLAAYGQVFIWYILPGLPLGFLALGSFLEGEYERPGISA